MTANCKPLFIIPARGGSKGIPRKNIVDLGGQPLIHHTINTARCLSDDRHIIVSTDDEEIAAVAEGTGLSVPYRRPPELATDTCGSREVILDAMRWADERGTAYDMVVLLQPTSPLRSIDDVRQAISLYSSDIDMVVTVTESSCNPYYDCFETDEGGFLHVSKGDGHYTRRQDAPRTWQYNGAVYVINPRSIRRMPMGEFRRRVPSPMPASRSIDIDTPIDLIVARNLIAMNHDND